LEIQIGLFCKQFKFDYKNTLMRVCACVFLCKQNSVDIIGWC